MVAGALTTQAQNIDKYDKVRENVKERKTRNWDEWGPTHKTGYGVVARAGWTIGGTTPLPIPQEIRAIHAFKTGFGFNLGAEAYKMVGTRWGMALGAYLSRQCFYTEADVKNYYMSITSEDGNSQSGWFTGTDVTDFKTLGVTVPVLAKFRMSPRWDLSFGPFFQFIFKKSFSGEVYDQNGQEYQCTDGEPEGSYHWHGVGYLRVDECDAEGHSLGKGPTGEKIFMNRDLPASYSLGDDMKTFIWGAEVVADWKATKHINVFGKLDWGLTSAFPSSFTVVQFKMYPIYGTLGVAYRY